MSGYIYAPGANSPDKAGKPQSALGCTYCMYYGGEMGRSKIIYHSGGWVARGWPESDNSAFRDRDNAGSLFPFSSNRLLDYRSYRGLIEREREREEKLFERFTRSLPLRRLEDCFRVDVFADFNCEILRWGTQR